MRAYVCVFVFVFAFKVMNVVNIFATSDATVGKSTVLDDYDYRVEEIDVYKQITD